MTFIEGVGDKVVDFFIFLGVLFVGWLAWCSTSITEQPLIRTVLILQDRTRTRIAELRANHQNHSSVTEASSTEVSEEESAESNSVGNNTSLNCPEISETNANVVSSESPRVSEAATSEEVIIEAMDSFNTEDSSLVQRQSAISTSETTNVSDTRYTISPNNTNNDELSTNAASEISIKLKFLNDDQRVVTGSPKELLGDFKRRHFQIELESQKIVRLIFNGQVLQPDSQSLERCGLYNNCVVHCLVYQPRPNLASTQASALDNSSPIDFNSQTFQDIPAATVIRRVYNEWDLSRLLVTILTLILGLAWYSRYHYAQLFTAAATLALYALTAIFTVFFFSNFFPDQDGIRNIE